MSNDLSKVTLLVSIRPCFELELLISIPLKLIPFTHSTDVFLRYQYHSLLNTDLGTKDLMVMKPLTHSDMVSVSIELTVYWGNDLHSVPGAYFHVAEVSLGSCSWPSFAHQVGRGRFSGLIGMFEQELGIPLSVPSLLPIRGLLFCLASLLNVMKPPVQPLLISGMNIRNATYIQIEAPFSKDNYLNSISGSFLLFADPFFLLFCWFRSC